MDPMQPTFGELVSFFSLCIAFGSLVYTHLQFKTNKGKTDTALIEERTEQRIRQQDMQEQLAKILNSVTAISNKLDDHTQALTRHTEQIGTIFRRLERMENVLDVKYREIGGTDD